MGFLWQDIFTPRYGHAVCCPSFLFSFPLGTQHQKNKGVQITPQAVFVGSDLVVFGGKDGQGNILDDLIFIREGALSSLLSFFPCLLMQKEPTQVSSPGR